MFIAFAPRVASKAVLAVLGDDFLTKSVAEPADFAKYEQVETWTPFADGGGGLLPGSPRSLGLPRAAAASALVRILQASRSPDDAGEAVVPLAAGFVAEAV